MFEQLPAWDSKITLRIAVLNAIFFGFAAGMAFGILFLKLVILRLPVPSELPDLGYFVVALALAVRLYFLAMSRAREAKGPSC